MNKSMKNQIVVYSIVLMLVVAGYLNYIENDNSVEISANTQNTTNIGDATLVNNNEIEEEKEFNTNTTETNEEENEISKDISDEKLHQNKSEETFTTSNFVDNTIDNNDEYFANSKLEREKMYSQMLETYQNILENTTISEEQKSIASNEITKINNNRNAIMICENLISIKGFEKAVILANGDSINVIVKAKDLSTENIAQIQNIITREMGTTIEDIHIMKK